MLVRVFEDLHGFFAAREIDIDRRAGQGIDGVFFKNALMFRDIVVLAANGHRIRYDEVKLEEEYQSAEPVKHELIGEKRVSNCRTIQLLRHLQKRAQITTCRRTS